MAEMIHKLEELTVHMAEQLGDTGYEEIVLFVDRREEIINELKAAPLSPAELLRFKHIYESRLEPLNRIIQQKMIDLKREAEEGMNRLQTAKVHRIGYEQNYPVDSILFDRKK